MIERSTGNSFRESHFRQFLTIVPDFFIHKWQVKKNGMELLIEVPENIHAIVNKYKSDYPDESDIEPSESPYNHILSAELLHDRV